MTDERPYPNEHSARLRNPKDFNSDTFRRTNGGTIYGSKKVPKTIAIIWGKLKGKDKPSDNPIPQALRFPVKNWTIEKAKKWLKDNDIKYILFEPAKKELIMKPSYRFGKFLEPQTEDERQLQIDERMRKFIISTATRDRHHTVLNPKKWDLKNYKKNPVVGYQHNIYGGFISNPDNVIGKGNVYLEDDNLIGEITFEPEEINPLAEKILKKIDFGTIRATSVGFYPKGKGKWGEENEAEGEKNETYYYGGQELIEFSIVNIPSNPDAVKRALPEDQGIFLRNFMEELVDLDWEEIEKLTVKGVFNIITGEEKVERTLENEENQNFDPELLSIQLSTRIRMKELEL